MNVSYGYDVSLDDVCYLISQKQTTDSIGNKQKTPIEKFCFCSRVSTSSKEFFSANQQGLKADITLLIDTLSYGGETKVKYEDKLYNAYRCYGRADGLTELYLTESR